MALLNSTGLTIRRYPELVSLIQNNISAGASAEIVFDEDLLITQLVNIIAVEMAALEEVIQALNDSKDRDKAEGEALDALLYNVGIERQARAKSSGIVQFFVTENVTIPTSTLVQNPGTSDRFTATSAVTASKSNSVVADFEVTEVVSGKTYSITVNGNTYSYVSEVGDTELDIVTGVVSAVVAANSPVYTAEIYSFNSKPNVRVYSVDESSMVVTTPQVAGFTGFSTPRFKINVPFEAVEYGAIIVPSHSVTSLVSGVGGVISLTNLEIFGTGRATESDVEFRARASQELAVSGSSTYSAMFTAIRNTEGVSNLVLVENATAATDSEGRPPHSFEAIVDVPDSEYYDQLIAKTIWNEKPIGIQSYSPEIEGAHVVIVDENGQNRTINFSRPQEEYIAIKVEYTLYGEEQPTINMSDVIRNIVLEYGQTLTSGVDVIPRRFIGNIYSGTEGLDEVTVYAQVLPTAGATPVELDWSTDRISITSRKTAVFNLNQIYTEDITV